MQHPIRGFFGDPRTVFVGTAAEDGVAGPGRFSFHQGVDIAAPDGTPIYSVSDGRAHYVAANVLDVRTGREVVFQYFHVVPVVGEHQRVWESRTILGYVQAPFGHVHLTEIDLGRAVDPLQRGHLTPYRDRTRPRIEAIALRNAGGTSPEPVCGRVEIDAQASDEPPLPVPGPFDGLPVAPALVTWSLARADGRAVVPRRVAADFRRRLPPLRDFWRVYARGTYENAPRFGYLQYTGTPGRYLFLLAARFDTRALRNGEYVLTVRAADERGNAAYRRLRLAVANGGSCPNQGQPHALPPVLSGHGQPPPPGSEEPPPTSP